jgi:DNA repair protein RadC
MKYKIEIKNYEFKESQGESITSPNNLFKALKEDYNPIQEELYLLILDVKNKLIEKILIAKGGMSNVTVEPASIFRNILINNGNRFVIAHNHPSGELSPSDEDLQFSRKIEKGAKLLGLNLIDNLIFTENSFFSFKRENLI